MHKYLLYIILLIPFFANANDYFKIRHYQTYCLNVSNYAESLSYHFFRDMNDYYEFKETNPIRAQQEKDAAYATLFATVIAEEPELDSEKLKDILHIIDIIYDSNQYAYTSVIERTYKECLGKYLLDQPYPVPKEQMP